MSEESQKSKMIGLSYDYDGYDLNRHKFSMKTILVSFYCLFFGLVNWKFE